MPVVRRAALGAVLCLLALAPAARSPTGRVMVTPPRTTACAPR